MRKSKREKAPGRYIRDRVEKGEIDKETGLPVTPSNEDTVHPLMKQREIKRNQTSSKTVEPVQEKNDDSQK